MNAGTATKDYPAVRLINGAALQYPLTVATDGPIYVQGDYNSVGWKPSAILGDAVTFLSAGWNDAAHAVFPAGPTAPSGEMWVYAAIAAGHSATPCDFQDPGCPGNHYGGGLENFPRFLENWGGVQMHYRGSLVSLFTSQAADLHGGRGGTTTIRRPATGSSTRASAIRPSSRPARRPWER